jgi:Beta-galactosidase
VRVIFVKKLMRMFANFLYSLSPLSPLPNGRGKIKRFGDFRTAPPSENHQFLLFRASWAVVAGAGRVSKHSHSIKITSTFILGIIFSSPLAISPAYGAKSLVSPAARGGLGIQCTGPRQSSLSEPGVPSQLLFGVINDAGQHFDDEWARGVRATTLELQWKRYEPQEGVYDSAYISQMQDRMRALKAQGWYVQLIPGYQYTPDWVFTKYADMYYVNQFGEAYTPDATTQGDFRVINAPFNPQGRALISNYLNHVFTQSFPQSDPGLKFDSVRVGGGVQGEVRYPPADWNGHAHSFWAFDAYAQDPGQIAAIPPGVVGWRPGIDPNPGTVGHGQLVVNPGFEDSSPDYPIMGWTFDDGLAAQRILQNPHEGSAALLLTLEAPDRAHQFIAVQPNTTYLLSGWVRSGDGVGRARLFLNQYDASQNPISGAPFLKLESLSQGWSEVNGSLTTLAGTHFLKLELDGDRPGNYYFDSLHLNRQGDPDGRDRQIQVPEAFYDWYVQAMVQYMDWQITTVRTYTDSQLDVVFAGKGVQTREITAALVNDLAGSSWSEQSSGLYAATAYDRFIKDLTGYPGVRVYLTGIEAETPSQVNDSSPYPSDWSAARWLAFLAHGHGLPIWGENRGHNGVEAMRLAAQRMFANGFSGLMWGFESELYASPNPGAYATIGDYQTIIQGFSNLKNLYLPFINRINQRSSSNCPPPVLATGARPSTNGGG